jgi:hypothetical protein
MGATVGRAAAAWCATVGGTCSAAATALCWLAPGPELSAGATAEACCTRAGACCSGATAATATGRGNKRRGGERCAAWSDAACLSGIPAAVASGAVGTFETPRCARIAATLLAGDWALEKRGTHAAWPDADGKAGEPAAAGTVCSRCWLCMAGLAA